MELNSILDWVFASFLVPLILFIFFYAKNSPWWKTAIGRIIMTQSTAWVLYIILVLIAREYRFEEWYEPLRGVVYFLIGAAFWGKFWQLIKAQKEAKKEKANKKR